MSVASQSFATLLNAPVPVMLERLGVAIAEAQVALDRSSLGIAKAMMDPEQGLELGGRQLSMLELGFTPTFYAFTEATLDVKLAFSMSRSREFSASGGLSVPVLAASVDASYTQKYSFDASGSSAIHARLVSLPPPQRLTELLRAHQASNPA